MRNLVQQRRATQLVRGFESLAVHQSKGPRTRDVPGPFARSRTSKDLAARTGIERKALYLTGSPNRVGRPMGKWRNWQTRWI